MTTHPIHPAYYHTITFSPPALVTTIALPSPRASTRPPILSLPPSPHYHHHHTTTTTAAAATAVWNPTPTTTKSLSLFRSLSLSLILSHSLSLSLSNRKRAAPVNSTANQFSQWSLHAVTRRRLDPLFSFLLPFSSFFFHFFEIGGITANFNGGNCKSKIHHPFWWDPWLGRCIR